ncbi:MAG: hypothetical protein NZM00_01155, partial [Anaerolinea sp.]|nr:hypothetical protein [Anaerolinea sp.]
MPFRPRRSVLLSILAFAVILSGLIALVTTPVLADEFVTAHEVCWSPDGRWLAVGSDSGLWLFETRTF